LVALRNGQDRSLRLSLRGRKPVAIRKNIADSSLRSELQVIFCRPHSEFENQLLT